MSRIYSHSALETFRSCPRKFKFQYVEKTKVTRRLTPDTHLGTSVHYVLSKLYKLAADGIVLPRQELIKLYLDEWEKINKEKISLVTDYYTVDDYIRIGEEMLVKHYDTYAPFKPGQLLGSELNIQFTLPGTSFRFRAIVDRIVRLDDGSVEIADYKSGQRIMQFQDPKFHFQMGLYLLAVKDRYPQFDKIVLAMYFLRHNEVVQHEMTQDEAELLTSELRGQILETINAERMDDFPAKESPFCSYCDYQLLCPAKRHKQLLEESASDDELTPEAQAESLASKFLDANLEFNKFKALKEELRKELISLARETGWSSFEGRQGKVSVKVADKEKFVTKTDSANEFADLSFLARELGLEDYFKLDGNGLLKEVYLKRLLPDEQLEKLAQYIRVVDGSRVSAKYIEDTDLEDKS
ncbi:MAG: PD-(D/E)XK nuclease family protein [bacterium]|nr:PD-(D/E)XK nuclease family protein [bacterium]